MTFLLHSHTGEQWSPIHAFLSPVAVSVCVCNSQVFSGCSQCLKPQDSQDDVHTSFSKLLSELNKPDAQFSLSIANRLYGEQSYQFVEVCGNAFIQWPAILTFGVLIMKHGRTRCAELHQDYCLVTEPKSKHAFIFLKAPTEKKAVIVWDNNMCNIHVNLKGEFSKSKTTSLKDIIILQYLPLFNMLKNYITWTDKLILWVFNRLVVCEYSDELLMIPGLFRGNQEALPGWAGVCGLQNQLGGGQSQYQQLGAGADTR